MRQHLTRHVRPGTSWNWRPGDRRPLTPQKNKPNLWSTSLAKHGTNYASCPAQRRACQRTAPVKTGLELWPSCGHSMPFIGSLRTNVSRTLCSKCLQGALLIPRHRARRQNLKRIKRQGFGPQLLGEMRRAVFNQINHYTASKKSRPCK